MAELHFSKKAVEDLSSIWNYTFHTWSEKQADIYYNMLVSACQRTIETTVVAAKPYPEIKEGLYGIHAGHHIIFFKENYDGKILIVRILHEKMDIKRHL